MLHSKWKKFSSNIKHLDNHLNHYCVKIDNNTFEAFNQIVKHYSIKSGYYYDANTKGIEISTTCLDCICDDSLLICTDNNIAFYFHHDGWLWFCQVKQSENNLFSGSL
ncbi:hypothetical protein GQ597_08260 [Gilliamella sp. Pra-s65]|uniref:hypothetical protein n=1 Tax=unclassified Gilliamella TaxID=2685620 RepID=UPI0013667130|nr:MULTISPECIES: hypothetical protein [unclassified Gilliamella]MWN90692.1 hypothetical protein [Gilliamella sp. Pra-s65]MWP46947.1 hypothetical protein [Gilliamella sp. Pas-s27]MWP73631.1 hypothetical protein [Gilliamella sp. Pra-s52]